MLLENNYSLPSASSADWFHQLLLLSTSSSGTNEQRLQGSKSSQQLSPQLLFINIKIRHQYGDNIKSAIIETIGNLFSQWNDDSDSSNVRDVLASMRTIGWPCIYHKEYLRAFILELEKYISSTCQGEYDSPQVPGVHKWLLTSLLPYAALSLGLQLTEGAAHMQAASSSSGGAFSAEANSYNIRSTEDVAKILTSALSSVFARVRAKELFEMVADFPDSITAIKELRDTATASDSIAFIGKIFKSTVKRRLLHTGASTSQILDIYVLMIRALRVLDPSDLLLNFVATPVRGYLMDRKDTVRSIVSSLTEGKDNELHGELRRGGSLEYGADEDDEDGGPGECWEPRRRDPDLVAVGVAGLDVLALLVSIYGSTDLFVSEYRSLLADKLLGNLQYNTDQEVATLELLKIRFGEEPLQSCEVMLRDMEDSRRVNNAVTSELRGRLGAEWQRSGDDGGIYGLVDYAIVSDNYWPPLGGQDGFKHHRGLSVVLSLYEETYASLKKPRRLHAVPELGQVDLELHFDDGSTRKFSVLPVLATIIMHIGDSGRLSLEELSTKCELEEEEVKKRAMYWVGKGVVAEGVDMEGGTVYEVVEEQAALAAADVLAGAGDLDQDQCDATHTASNDVREKASLLEYERYIRGMLSSSDKMSLERMHQMLKMMASGGAGQEASKFDMTLMQLHRFLQTLIDANKIELVDGVYTIRK